MAGGVGTADPGAPILPPLGIRGRFSLGREVLAAYGEVRWRLAREDLETALRALRTVPGAPTLEPGLRSRWHGVRLAKAVRHTLRLVPADSRCLMRSLVLTRMLARRGIGSVLVIAVKPEPSFRAHAWVEHEGLPLLPTGGYERLLEL